MKVVHDNKRTLFAVKVEKSTNGEGMTFAINRYGYVNLRKIAIALIVSTLNNLRLACAKRVFRRGDITKKIPLDPPSLLF